MKQAKRKARVFRAKTRLLCPWATTVEVPDSERRKGNRYALHCNECWVTTFLRSLIDMPERCPRCFEGGKKPQWASRLPEPGEHTLQLYRMPTVWIYRCTYCRQDSSFDSDNLITERCPHCDRKTDLQYERPRKKTQ